jgi:hypothetical protein
MVKIPDSQSSRKLVSARGALGSAEMEDQTRELDPVNTGVRRAKHLILVRPPEFTFGFSGAWCDFPGSRV